MLTLALLAVNIMISIRAFQAFRGSAEAGNFLFSPYQVAHGRNVRGMILSQFSHGDIGHLIFNMLSLYFFAPVVESLLGSHLLTIYLVSAAAATALVFLIHRNNPNYRVLGASGAVSGVIFASIVLNPGMSVFFFFIPIPIPGPVFAVAYLAISTYFMRQGVGNISHEAHVGGALAGFVLAGLLSPRGFWPLWDRLRDIVGMAG